MSSYLFKTLSDTGIIVVGALSFLVFVLQCVAVTSAWHKTGLSDCVISSAKNSNGDWVDQPGNVTSPDISLYTQPRYGICSKANYFALTMDTCQYVWTDSTFWEEWDQIVDAGSSAYYDAANTYPDVYRILCVTVVFSMLSWMMVLISWFKEEYVSRWITQLVCALFAFVAFITFMYSTIASSASELVNADMWAKYYVSKGISCVNNEEMSYAGVQITGVALVLNLIIYLLCAFPTCFNNCTFCVSDISDFEATAVIVEGNKRSDSDYVPPAGEKGKDYVPPLV